MLNYITNVILSAAPYLAVGGVIGGVLPFVATYLSRYVADGLAKTPEEWETNSLVVDRWSRVATVVLMAVGALIIAAGLTLSMIAPANLPKNETHDRAAKQRQVEEVNQRSQQERKGTISDRTRSADMTHQERQNMFDDMVDWRDVNDRKADR